MDQVTSLWQLKPWWCQPWSIVLSGCAAIALSWLALHRWWISGPVAMAVLAWWGLFLVLVPAAFRAEQAKGPASPTHFAPEAPAAETPSEGA